jgi:hypothetical protein
MISILALAMVLASVACNSTVVGPSETTGTTSSDPVRPANERDKVCIEELGVEITSPYEDQLVHVGQLVVVQWNTRHVCGQGSFVAAASVSYDDGASWHVIGSGKNLASAAWRVGNFAGVAPRIQVTVDNTRGAFSSDELQLGHAIGEAPDDGPRDPSEHD